MKRLRWKILYLLSGLALGCAAATSSPPSTPVVSTSSLTPGPASTEQPVPVRPFPQDSILKVINKWRADFPGQSAVACGPLDRPTLVSLNGDQTFEAASLVKLAILVELARRFESGQCRPEDTLVFEERFRVGGSGHLQKEPAGGKYRLDKLGEWAISESDNVATDMLFDYLKLDTLEPAMRDLGLKQMTVQRTIFAFEEIERGHDNLISANDMALLLGKIARQELPGSKWMLEVLGKTHRHDLLQAGLPKGLEVAHKSGELTGFLHDAGILFSQPPYVVVILTRAEKADSESFIRGLSREIYECHQQP
ncbi:MAG: serine hydrolase [Vulcanimicrobiota bacterium]